MAEMRDFAREAWEAATRRHVHAQPVAEGGDTRNVVTEVKQEAAVGWTDVAHLFHRHHDDQPSIARHVEAARAAPQTPATAPASLAAAPAAAGTQQEETMSLITDAEAGWNAAEAEIAKLRAALPGALAKAKAFETSPFAQLAEKVAGGVLPPEAVTIAVNAADKVIDDLIGLYSTPAAEQTQQPAGAPQQ